MKKYSVIIGLALAIMILNSGCVKELFGCISGEGSLESRVVEFDEISGFDVFGSNNITIIEGEQQVIEITSFPNIIDRWLEDSFVEDGVLNAGIEGCVTGFNNNDITIRATISSLHLIAISGSGDAETEGIFNNVDDLEIDISGSGDIDLELGQNIDEIEVKIAGSGNVDLSGIGNSADIKIAGSGKINNFDLDVLNSNIDMSGSGEANVSVSEKLEVKITGSGNVCYMGQPQVDSEITGSGKLKNCN